MAEKRRYHFNIGEVKSGIIEFILRHKGLIKEPFIRRSLQEKYDKIDQGTVNRHLHDLYKLGCINLMPPSKETTRSNRWSISTLQQLENIRKHFPIMQLNRYEKSLDIISRYHLYFINPVCNIIFRVQLLLSTSFFDLCIKNDGEKLYSKAYEIYRFGRGFEDNVVIQNYIDDIYADLRNRIFKNSNFLLCAWNKQPNSLKTGAYPDPSKYILDIEISEETFKHMLDIRNFSPKKSQGEVHGRNLVEKISIQISAEIFRNSLKEIFEDSPINARKLYSNISNDIFNKIVEEDPQKLYQKIAKINDYQLEILDKTPSIIFEHCFEADILDNTVSDEEKEFVKRKKSSVQKDSYGIMSYDEWYFRSKIDASGDGDTMNERTAYDDLYDEYLIKYMIPCIEAS
jgi:hypothetical protein